MDAVKSQFYVLPLFILVTQRLKKNCTSLLSSESGVRNANQSIYYLNFTYSLFTERKRHRFTLPIWPCNDSWPAENPSSF